MPSQPAREVTVNSTAEPISSPVASSVKRSRRAESGIRLVAPEKPAPAELRLLVISPDPRAYVAANHAIGTNFPVEHIGDETLIDTRFASGPWNEHPATHVILSETFEQHWATIRGTCPQAALTFVVARWNNSAARRWRTQCDFLLQAPVSSEDIRFVIENVEPRSRTSDASSDPTHPDTVVAFARFLRLTPSETRIVQATFEGHNTRDIERALRLKPETIRKYFSRIYAKAKSTTGVKVASKLELFLLAKAWASGC